MSTTGLRLFAAYAWQPSGTQVDVADPLLHAALTDSPDDAAIMAATTAARESVTWPYLQTLATLWRADVFDTTIVRTVWTGSPDVETIDGQKFGRRLLEDPQVRGGDWDRFSLARLAECSPVQIFHILALGGGCELVDSDVAGALELFNEPRVRWGRVEAVDGDYVNLKCRRIGWEPDRLVLNPPSAEQAQWRDSTSGASLAQPAEGDWVAVRGSWVREILDADSMNWLKRTTLRQIDAANVRLRDERGSVLDLTGTTPAVR